MSKATCDRETAINMIQGEGYAVVYTCMNNWKARMQKLLESHPDEVSVMKDCGDEFGTFYKVPSSWVRVRPPAKRNLTDEQRAELRNRLMSGKTSVDM